MMEAQATPKTKTDSKAADALLQLLDAAEEEKKSVKPTKKRAHKPRRPYRCGRCGLPKSGHICALRKEQRSTAIQTDHTSLALPCHSLSLLSDSCSASDDGDVCSDDVSDNSPPVVRCITDEATSDAGPHEGASTSLELESILRLKMSENARHSSRPRGEMTSSPNMS